MFNPAPWEIYENLNEIVYVMNPKTYEMIYLNKFGRKSFGNKPLSDIKGLPCYKLLQNLSAPCSFCPNQHLSLNQFYEWQYYNPVLKTKFLLKDTLIEYNNKIYKMEITINATDKNLDVSLPETTLHNEMIMKEFLKNIHSFDDIDMALNSSLQFLGEMLYGERAYIFEETSDKLFINNTYEWCRNNVIPQKNNLQNVPKTSVISWYEMFQLNENMIIEDIEKIKHTYPTLYDILKPQEITSLVVSPLYYENEIIGFFGIDNPPKEKFEYISSVLSILSHFIVSTLKRRDLMQELHFLSYHDQLTKALNRNALKKYIKKEKKPSTLGILYGDITGLKKINDTFGHSKGDELIKTAYNYIYKVFSKFDIYRVGGDEFLVLCPNIELENFNKLVNILKVSLDNSNSCTIAIGDFWTSSLSDMKEVESLIDMTDKKMYEAKQEYYKTHKKYR